MKQNLINALEYIHEKFSKHNYQLHFFTIPTLRYINVSAKTLHENRENGKNKPTLTVRSAENPMEERKFHYVEILGDSKIFPTPDHPLPNTEGRAVCYVHTEALLVCVLVEYDDT